MPSQKGKKRKVETNKVLVRRKRNKIVESYAWKPVGLDAEALTRLQRIDNALEQCLVWVKCYPFAKEWYQKNIRLTLTKAQTLRKKIQTIKKEYDQFFFASPTWDGQIMSYLYDLRTFMKKIFNKIKIYKKSYYEEFRRHHAAVKIIQRKWRRVHKKK